MKYFRNVTFQKIKCFRNVGNPDLQWNICKIPQSCYKTWKFPKKLHKSVSELHVFVSSIYWWYKNVQKRAILIHFRAVFWEIFKFCNNFVQFYSTKVFCCRSGRIKKWNVSETWRSKHEMFQKHVVPNMKCFRNMLLKVWKCFRNLMFQKMKFF